MSTTRQSRRRTRTGLSGYAPYSSASSHDAEDDEFWLDRELSMIENALAERGEMRRGELGRMLGCRYWGPRRFARALRIGSEEGRFQHTGFGRYAPASGRRPG